MTALEMFENICYRKRVSDDCILYENGNYIMCNIIEFCLKDKTIYSFTNSEVGREAKSLSVNELKAINKQCEELGWLESDPKQETNLEHYFDELLKVGNRFTFMNGKIKSCNSVMCSKCVFESDCGVKRFKWLASSYVKPTYKLSQFEFDLLNAYKNSGMRRCISNYGTLLELYKKGYFKEIGTSIPIHEILDNYEVIK
jgi:hypothetical protein